VGGFAGDCVKSELAARRQNATTPDV